MEAFASRDFRRYQMARVAVILGAEAQAVAVAWQVYSITHRALDLGYTGLALFLPGLLFLLPAGHVADRFDRRHVILCCYTLQVFSSAALLVQAITGTHRVAYIYAVLFVIGTGRAFSSPASSALMPQLVPEKHFVNAVTWGGAIFQLANVTGPALGGLLFTLPLAFALRRLGLEGAGIVYIFTLVTLVWFLALILSLHVRPGRMEHRAASLKVVLAGFQYVRTSPLLLGSMSLDLFVVLLGGAVALMPIFASEVSAHGSARAGCAASCAGDRGPDDVAGDGAVPDQPQSGRADVCVRGDLWRRNGDLWHVEEPVAFAGGAGCERRCGHDQRDHSRITAATGDAAGDARPGERGEFSLYRRIQ